jgi:hypothetical protein
MSLFAIFGSLFLFVINFLPYYFESYYLYLIVPCYLLLLPELTAASRYRAARLCQLSVGMFGVVYSILKALPRD